ncbi:hypothetical protein [Ruminococcus albus]|uniref:DUF5640 domain-containing protein n=1 Tax=Ruminococcus albus TaxID=1264 RepID=A0A1H7I243_RUMAL|nr:hypothetical protein [Ruminococcus albus]SEK55902.1 hypothetical protein SAMN05216469_103181 [Ruminococcus albus]
MNIKKRITAFSVAVVMMTSIFSMTASADYDDELYINKSATEGDISVEKGSGGDHISLRFYWAYFDKTNIVDGYLHGSQYDNYFTLKSAYRINGRTYDSKSGKNGSDEREVTIKQTGNHFNYEKKVKSKKMDWVNMRGYTYISNKKTCPFSNRADLKITRGEKK